MQVIAYNMQVIAYNMQVIAYNVQANAAPSLSMNVACLNVCVIVLLRFETIQVRILVPVPQTIR